MLSHSGVFNSFATPWTVAHQASLSMGIGLSRQEYLHGLPCPSLGDFPNPGFKPSLPHYRCTLYHLSYQGAGEYDIICVFLKKITLVLCYPVWQPLATCGYLDSIQFSSVTQSCLTICDPMNHRTPDPPVHHQLPEFTQTHVH